MTDGIYTLANDVVYDQLVALLNSLEANSPQLPVCVIAYNDQLEKVRAEISSRPNVTLLNDPDLFTRWEDFSYQVWQTHPTALQTWKEMGVTTRFYRVGENHRYCAFDAAAPFDRFIYLDADTLVMQPLDFIFKALNDHDFAVYDFQFKDPGHIYNLNSAKLPQVFDQARLASEIFCSGCYAAKRGLFTPEQRDWLVSQLQQGEAEILYLGAPNQSVLNYLTMKSGLAVYNFALHLPADKRTGNSVTSPHFQFKDGLVYDRGVLLTYLHYIGVSSKLFQRLCAGENIGFPYRDVFLHYRYLKAPQESPQLTGKLEIPNAPPSLLTKALKKLKLMR